MIACVTLGGQNESAPGPRHGEGIFMICFRDKKGHKLAVFTMTR